MASVTYAGSREELIGQKFDVPAGILQKASGNSVAEFIERKVDSDSAIEAAETEATARRQQSLASRMESERLSIAQQSEEQNKAEGQQARDSEFSVELSDLSQAVMTSGAAIVGQADRAEAKMQQWESRGESTISRGEEITAKAEQQVAFAQASTQQATEQLDEHMSQQRQQFGELESTLFALIADKVGPVGPAGPQGIAAAGVGLVPGNVDVNNTDRKSLAQNFFGKNALTPGDLLFQTTKDAIKVWRTPEGGEFILSGEILNKQELISQRLAVTDNSSHSTLQQSIQKFGGGGGSAPITTRVLPGGAKDGFNNPASPVVIADGGAYSADLERLGEYSTSCKAIVEIICADGPNAGASQYATFDILQNQANGVSLFTESAVLDDIGVQLDAAIEQGAGYPPSYAPTGAKASLTHTPRLLLQVTSDTSGATSFWIKGSVIWSLPTDNGKALVAKW